MRNISDTAGSFSTVPSSWEIGNTPTSFAGKIYDKELISQADSVPLIQIFKKYGLRINEANRTIICPFKSHKGGRESTASFKWYPETNSYHCFGCRAGNHACDFVAEMEHCDKTRAAHKILELFGDYVNGSGIVEQENFALKLEIMMEFSNMVREFRQNNTTDHAEKFIELMCSIYDELNLRHHPNEIGLRSIVDQLKNSIISYTPNSSLDI